MNPSQTIQAQSVEEIYLTTQNSPLTTEAEIAAFYRDEVNAVRGGDKVQRLRLGLIRAHQNRTYFKALFMGHQGVGKSTELSRLVNQITEKFAGGNLRDLFSLVNYAADSAQLRSAQTVGQSDVGEAIVHLRSAYERRLGQSPYDSEKVTYQNKADRLKQIYEGDSKAQVADEVIYSLLRSKAVQEFNGQRWFGVHPLVVDILVKQKEIPRPETGGVPGGTE